MMLVPPAKSRRPNAECQARYRERRRLGIVLAKGAGIPSADRGKLVSLGYLAPARRNDARALGEALAKLVALMRV
jgi:hypothetical protein